jgi:hypothetical protein
MRRTLCTFAGLGLLSIAAAGAAQAPAPPPPLPRQMPGMPGPPGSPRDGQAEKVGTAGLSGSVLAADTGKPLRRCPGAGFFRRDAAGTNGVH